MPYALGVPSHHRGILAQPHRAMRTLRSRPQRYNPGVQTAPRARCGPFMDLPPQTRIELFSLPTRRRQMHGYLPRCHACCSCRLVARDHRTTERRSAPPFLTCHAFCPLNVSHVAAPLGWRFTTSLLAAEPLSADVSTMVPACPRPKYIVAHLATAVGPPKRRGPAVCPLSRPPPGSSATSLPRAARSLPTPQLFPLPFSKAREEIGRRG